MNLGVTGHQKLDKSEWWNWVEQELITLIEKFNKESNNSSTAVSSLAIGADQLFANLVLKTGGKLYAVIPFPNYNEKFEGDGLEKYNQLLNQANEVETLTSKSTDEESYFAAGKRMVELSDIIIAVWNGKKAAGLGGTGDVVEYAKEIRKKIIHINPNLQTIKDIN